jgi:1,4-alpha-glucan branching enzyme
MTTDSDSACEFGVTRLTDGRVRFRLWAPAQETVSVAFGAVGAVTDGALYGYRLADGVPVPDPASRRQSAGVQRLADTVSLVADAIGPKAVLARWRMGDRSLGADPVPFKSRTGRLLFSTGYTDPMAAAYLEIAE